MSLYLFIYYYVGGANTSAMASMKFMSTDVTDFEKNKLPFELDGSSDSDFSYDSEASDGTYIPSSDDDAYVTAKSRENSVVPSPETVLPVSMTVVKKEIKSERPASRTSRSSRCNTPVVQSPYNLRSRSSIRPLNPSVASNESPEAFGQIVKHMERITRHNAQQIIQTVKKNHTPSYYSSDDE